MICGHPTPYCNDLATCEHIPRHCLLVAGKRAQAGLLEEYEELKATLPEVAQVSVAVNHLQMLPLMTTDH